MVKKILIVITAIIVAGYVGACIWVNSVAVDGNTVDSVDLAIEKIKNGETTLFVEYDLIDKIDSRIWCDPELFYISHRYPYDNAWKILYPFNKIKLTIPRTDYDVESAKIQINDVVRAAFCELDIENATDYEKALYSYMWIVQNVEYTTDETNGHNIYGAFVERKAICDGYANALTYMLSYAGVESYTIGGNVIENGTPLPHAWTLAYIDGIPYYFDATHGDVALCPELQSNCFAVTPYEFNQNHTIDQEFNNIVADVSEHDIKINSIPKFESEITYINQLNQSLVDESLKLQQSNVPATDFIAMLVDKMGESQTFKQYIQMNVSLSYTDNQTGEISGYQTEAYAISNHSNGVFHTVASKCMHVLDGDIGDIYATAESYSMPFAQEAFVRTAINALSTNWEYYDATSGEDATNQILCMYSFPIMENTEVFQDNDGNYVLITQLINTDMNIVNSGFVAIGPIVQNSLFSVSVVKSDLSEMYFYISDAHLDTDVILQEYNATDSKSQVSMFVKLYDFGKPMIVEIPDDALKSMN